MSNKKKPALNISSELFDAWQTLRRTNDAEAIANKYGWSRPTIDNALNYGHVNKQEIIEQISEFFVNRKEKERATAASLTEG